MEESRKERYKGAGSLLNSLAVGVFITTFMAPIVAVAIGSLRTEPWRFMLIAIIACLGIMTFAGLFLAAQEYFRRAE